MAKTGIAIEPIGPRDDDPLAGEVAVEFELPKYLAEKFEILGQIRHMTRTPEGRVILGIKFKDVTPTEVKILDQLHRDLDLARLMLARHDSTPV